MTPLKIDIWSDIACPWCYIGKRRLEAGLDAFRARPGAVPVEIEYHSFQLAPDTPAEFEGSAIDYLVQRKRVPTSTAQDMVANVTRFARSVGLHYDYDALRPTNTGKAHQLLHHAKANGRQEAMKERLLRGYFVEGRHLGRVEELADLAADVGLDRDDVTRALAEGTYVDAVHADRQLAARLGIAGVPFYVIDGRHGISGAQRPQVFTDVLVEVAESRVQAG